MNKAEAILGLHPALVPNRDFRVEQDESGDQRIVWLHPSLPRPSQAQLEQGESQYRQRQAAPAPLQAVIAQLDAVRRALNLEPEAAFAELVRAEAKQ